MNNQICREKGCDYQLDLDGQVTCFICGAMDDDMSPPKQSDFWETQVSFEE